MNQIDALRGNLKEAAKIIRQVDEIVRDANLTAEEASRVMDRWKAKKGIVQEAVNAQQKNRSCASDSAYEVLRRAREFLNTEGRDAWERAKFASEKYGEQSAQLSRIAQEARKLAERHRNSSDHIEEFAKKALNTSRKALTEARDAIFGGEKTSAEIQNLRDRYGCCFIEKYTCCTALVPNGLLSSRFCKRTF